MCQVELPARAETVPHDHTDDQVEDTDAFLRGSGWVVMDRASLPVRAGQFVGGDGQVSSAGPRW